MTKSTALERGRQAFHQQAWADAYAFLSSADEKATLDAETLELLAKAAYLIGQESNSTDTWARAHQKFLDQNDTEGAANSAFWLGIVFSNRGDKAQASASFRMH